MKYKIKYCFAGFEFELIEADDYVLINDCFEFYANLIKNVPPDEEEAMVKVATVNKNSVVSIVKIENE